MGAFKDLTGQRFGKLTILEYAGKSTWKCICDCGTIEYAKTQKLVGGKKLRCSICIHVPDRIGIYTPIRPVGKVRGKFVWEFRCEVCGSLIQRLPEDLRRRQDTTVCRCQSNMGKYQDLTGQKFGRLTVLSQFYKGKVKYCKCECSCSDHTIKDINASNLVRGLTKSCGCLSRETTHKTNFKSVIGHEINGFKIIAEYVDDNYKHIVTGSCIYCGSEFKSELSNLRKAKTHLCSCKEYFVRPLKGQVFGKWAVLADAYNDKHEHICLCSCGCGKIERYVKYASLVNGLSRSCGCDAIHINTRGSSDEIEIKDFICSLCDDVPIKDHSILGRKEIDLLFLRYNIGIEYNGSLFHASLNSLYDNYKPKDYHQQKFLLAKEKGIHLINIFDVDWWHNKEKIKQYLFSLFSQNKKIFARKCNVENINKSMADDFFNKYHLQGETHFGSINYGLYYNGELVSIMSFGKLRLKRQQEGFYELHRYAVKDGYTIVGGANKLLKHFEVEYNPKYILSYSDNDYFVGGIYELLGFKVAGQSTPRYYWNKGREELKREKCQLKYLKIKYPELYQEAIDNTASNKEDYIMTSLGYCKVYRSGNTKWEKTYETI